MNRQTHIDRVLKDIREVWMAKPRCSLLHLLIDAKDAEVGHNDVFPGDHESSMFRYRLVNYRDDYLLDGIATLRKRYGIDPGFTPPTKPDDDDLQLT